MKDKHELAALYALGALNNEERASVEERIAAGDRELAEAVHGHEALVAEMTMATSDPEDPPAALREEILKRVRSTTRKSAFTALEDGGTWEDQKVEGQVEVKPGLFTVHHSGGRWERLAVRGISIKRLYLDRGQRRVTTLVRMEPGSSYPAHRHHGPEECLVLEGDLRFDDQVMRAGDYQRAESNSRHSVQHTEDGCLLLITSSLDDEVLS